MTFAQVILDELLIFWAPLVLVCIGLPVKRAFLWQCGRIVNCHGAALFIVRLPKTLYQYTENTRHYKFPLCKFFFTIASQLFGQSHIFRKWKAKQNRLWNSKRPFHVLNRSWVSIVLNKWQKMQRYRNTLPAKFQI